MQNHINNKLFTGQIILPCEPILLFEKVADTLYALFISIYLRTHDWQFLKCMHIQDTQGAVNNFSALRLSDLREEVKTVSYGACFELPFTGRQMCVLQREDFCGVSHS